MQDSTTQTQKTIFSLSVAALGIVYGDIGTSPLYAVRALGDVSINIGDILGILSLIFWTLILVISIKYLLIIFKADNNGEGGILALLALFKRSNKPFLKLFFVIGIFGAGLMLGDGMLTPAMSVISACEGLNVIAPNLSSWVLGLSCVILIALFLLQPFGSTKIGFMFGPILFVWFCTLAILGGIQIFHNPVVLKAVNPYYAYHYLFHHGWSRYVVLGGIFLVVTGGEALYADLGHFGKTPIRVSWFSVVLPGLLLNYFGQGAYLLAHPEGIVNPFYMMASRWFLVPLLILATVSAVIASQAVISATFSMVKQAILLGLYPRVPIRQTSAEKEGQIYIPHMNLVLAIGTLLLVLIFRSSTAIAHAYGIAVNLTMLLVTFMVGFAAYKIWRWNMMGVLLLFSFFLLIDFAFLGANAQKIKTGGWVPILFAIVCAFVMYTWHKSIAYFRRTYYKKEQDLLKNINQLYSKPLNRLSNFTAIFLTDTYDKVGISFLHFLDINRILPENLLIVNFKIESVPYMTLIDRYELTCLGENICQLTLRYGFMDFISVPQDLVVMSKRGVLPFEFDPDTATYFIEIHNIIPSYKKKTELLFIQKKIFAFLMRNYSANFNIDFYRLPYNRTIAIGAYHVI